MSRFLRRGVVSLAVSAFVGATAGCVDTPALPPPPPEHTMVFKRDLHKGDGCLDYSWVSEDKRRVIQLTPNMKEGVGEGPMAGESSHVQVHALSNGLYGLKEWQFPSGPPHLLPVVRATVEVKETEAVGTVFYQDESSATDKQALLPMPVTCPTKGEEASTVDPTIKALDPFTVKQNTAVTITLMGAHFTRDSFILIDGADPTTKFVSPSMLEAELDAEDTASLGKRAVKVHSVKDATISNEMTLTVE